MKKILSVLISVLLIISCGACAKEESKNKKKPDNKSVSAYVSSSESVGDSDVILEDVGVSDTNDDTAATYIAKRIEAGADGFISPVEKKTEVPEGYIGIHNAQEFDSIRYNANANYILMNDIDLSELESWTTIEILNGELDGNGYAIRGLSKINSCYEAKTASHLALFNTANVIKNIAVIDVNISPSTDTIPNTIYGSPVKIGAIAIFAQSLYNCYSTGNISLDNTDLNLSYVYIGGLTASVGLIDSCYSTCYFNVGQVKCSTLNVGGLTTMKGSFDNPSITNSFYEGNINIIKNNHTTVGGIISGVDYKDHTIVKNCRSSGTINITGVDGFTSTFENDVFVGGILGISNEDIENCYSNMDINATFTNEIDCYVGGIVGKCNAGCKMISYCYNTGNINLSSTGEAYGGGIAGRFGKFGSNAHQETYNINNCFNIGSITADTSGEIGYSGGICAGVSSHIINSYNTGDINGNNPGAIAGEHGIENTKLVNCYYTNQDIGALSVNAMFENVKRLSEAEAQNESSYAGFNFKSDNSANAVWTINQNKTYNYPTLTNLYFEQ